MAKRQVQIQFTILDDKNELFKQFEKMFFELTKEKFVEDNWSWKSQIDEESLKEWKNKMAASYNG